VGVAALVVACGSSSTDRASFDDGTNGSSGGNGIGGGDNGTIGGKQAGEDPKADECQKMDIVFIVDDSGSMAEEQSNLAANFPQFVNVLKDFKTKSGAALDWRVAVTTTGRDLHYQVQPPGFPNPIPMTEKGDNGAFRDKPECASQRRWVQEDDHDATSTFACLAKVGTGGPSIEMPLKGLELSLTARMSDGTNKGFLRDDALLAVVIITDEDDCSRDDDNFTIADDSCQTMANLRPLTSFNTMLDTAAKGPGRWAAAAIAGDKECTSSFGKAIEAKRLKQFISGAGKNGTFSSICSGDLTTGLKQALDTFDAVCKSFPGIH